MQPPENRSYQSSSARITTRIAQPGFVIVTVSSGPVSIVVTVPESQIGFLFDTSSARAPKGAVA